MLRKCLLRLYPLCAQSASVPAVETLRPAFRHCSHSLADPEEYAVAVSGAKLSADFLSPQSEPTRVEQFQSPGWTLDFYDAQVKARVICPLPPGWASLGLMRSPTPSVWHGLSAGKGMLVCTPPGEQIDGWFAPGFSCLAVNVPLTVWERSRLTAGIDRLEFGRVAAIVLPLPVYERLESRMQSLQCLLRTALTDLRLAAAAEREAAAFAEACFTLAWELQEPEGRRERESSRNRARLARRAEEWMREHLAEAMQIPDVCIALRVSRRELEYSFRATFDQSPREFLHALRLNAIRRALRRRGGRFSVLEVALEFGMSHVGRFAAQYRRLFGENPSKT